ncbi:MAG: hypothetical protein O3A53_19520, partial [Acidobacteria bacterium]|nr:hypothetical protein [Acidobacteriota bacterium]MDA1236972.1 hypothetical protein [Acidobacteriota bacterium]
MRLVRQDLEGAQDRVAGGVFEGTLDAQTVAARRPFLGWRERPTVKGGVKIDQGGAGKLDQLGVER